jgi:hypothetical protein
VEGARLNNGELVTVKRVEPNGNLAVKDEHGATKTLSPSQRLFVRGFAVTSYGSQGKNVDTVLFSDAGSRAATNAQQWYVTISRGKRRVVVFTPDKAQLRAGIEQPHVNDLALDRDAIELGVHLARQQTQRNRERIDLAQRHQQAMRMNAREGRGMKT